MTENNQEKFKTSIGGQALIEGIMMRGPQKDAVVVRTNGELDISVTQRKVRPKGSVLTWPLIRGVVNFFDAQVVGVKALMHSADLVPEEEESQEQSRFDKWLEEKLGNEKFQSFVIGCAVTLGICMSIGLFFLIPMVIGGFLTRWIDSNLVLNLVEGDEVTVSSPVDAFEPFVVHYAETFIIPACVGEYTITPGNAEEGKTYATIKAYVRF